MADNRKPTTIQRAGEGDQNAIGRANPYQPPPIGVETGLLRFDTSRGFGALVTASAFAGAIWSFATVAYDASEEPFVGNFDATDWLVMFVGAGLGVLFWLGWAWIIAWAVISRRWPECMIFLLVIAVSVGYIQYWCFTGYVGDRRAAIEIQAQH